MNRIEAIYSYIDSNDKVVDVGCDQAKLSIMLANNNQSSIACDISKKVISRAKNSINNPLIDLRVSNGLENIKENEADTLVLSGMGSYTILDILSNTTLRFKKIITISNNYHELLRKKMNDLNYKIKCEQIIKENNKYYNLILFEEGMANYSEDELLLGINHKDKKLYKEYLYFLLKKYELIKKKTNNERINNIYNNINERLKLL